MLIDRQRDKLINVIVYFATHTRFPGKTKLFKLLYFLDFEHFKETGRSVTGLNYSAWPKGPVPVNLHEEIEKPQEDLGKKVKFVTKSIKQGVMLEITPLAEFDPKHFSKRELRLLENIVTKYAASKADDMVEATHLENQPWHKVYVENGQKQAHIPYDLAIRRQETKEMQETVRDRNDLISHFRGK